VALCSAVAAALSLASVSAFAQGKAVADIGGVIGLWHLFPSALKYVQGVREMVDIVGPDHVGIGMDWPIEGINHIWPDQTEGMMYTVIREMLKLGKSRSVGTIATRDISKVRLLTSAAFCFEGR
jgi:microsomal dipeptidase-like Zn-dependent dipeptidase